MTTVERPAAAGPPSSDPTPPDPADPAPTGPAPIRLALAGRTLLLVAGMPGAGKSTLLAGVARRPGLTVLDSDAHRAALARRLPALPYRRFRPLVHLLHRLALVRAACGATPTVAVHLPATAAGTRLLVALLAVLTGRSAHLLWVHADPAEALAGQRARGRVVPSGSHARHARRAADAARRLGRGRSWGFRSVTVVDRARARAGLVLDARPLP